MPETRHVATGWPDGMLGEQDGAVGLIHKQDRLRGSGSAYLASLHTCA